jgi:hypothetical protein
MWVCKPGESRPKAEIFSRFSGASVFLVRVEDPYALGDQRARAAQIVFLSDLTAVARRVGAMTLVYNPDVRGEGDDTFRRSQFHRRLNTALGGAAPPVSLVARERRSRGGDFHDRSVQVEVEGPGGSRLLHELHLSRGLVALYNENTECTITYKSPRQ